MVDLHPPGCVCGDCKLSRSPVPKNRATRRTLPPVPSIAQIERSMSVLVTTAEEIPAKFREALEIAYALESKYDAKGSGGDQADPTLSAVVAGLLNAEGDPDTGKGAEPDRWSPERTAIRAAVDSMAVAVFQLGTAHSRLHRITQLHERRGMAVGDKSGKDGDVVGKAASQSWTAEAAEKVADEYDVRADKEGRRPRAVDPRDWRPKAS